MSEFDYPSFDSKKFANETLWALEGIYQAARSKLDESRRREIGNPIANCNDFNSMNAINSLKKSSQEVHDGYVSLIKEPAIARVTLVNKQGKVKRYYVSRLSSVIIPDSEIVVASYRSPRGQIASHHIGDEFFIDGEEYELVENAELYPYQKKEWDSIDTYVKAVEEEVTIRSLRGLLGTFLVAGDEGSSEFEFIFEDDDIPAGGAAPIIKGRKRRVIGQSALPDTTILDKIQDEVFRYPIDNQLFLYGPPGTGKTTTLIKRLGLKLDVKEGVTDEERRVLNKVENPKSWVMFTPTELLRLYVKEAFNRECIPASDEHIHTWDKYRVRLGDAVKLLETPNRKGFSLMSDSEIKCSGKELIIYYSTVRKHFAESICSEIRNAIEKIVTSELPAIEKLKSELLGKKRSFETNDVASVVVELSKYIDKISNSLTALVGERKRIVKEEALAQHTKDKKFLSELYRVIKDDTHNQLSSKEINIRASKAYERALVAYCEQIAVGKKTKEGTQSHIVLKWLDKRVPKKSVAIVLGNVLSLIDALKVLGDPLQLFFKFVKSEYSLCRSSYFLSKWKLTAETKNALYPEELDTLLLILLSTARDLLERRDVNLRLNTPFFASLKPFRELMYTQVVVDEATDFSPIQLACMRCLSSPEINSFFACGDFNQRITGWGAQNFKELEWAVPKLQTKEVKIPYRQSVKLQQFVYKLVDDMSVDDLPEVTGNSDHEYPPALGLGLSSSREVADWLVKRITEVYVSVELSSMAVLVSSEQEVGEIAKNLEERLPATVPVTACHEGKMIGTDAGVRVFDIQHIKGMEFEAAFFVGVDDLLERLPDLYSKFLYVGATRAATFLGFTCRSESCPEEFEDLAALMCEGWNTTVLQEDLEDIA